MIIGVPKEIYTGERRVAIVPSGVTALREMGFDVLVESCAGDNADYANAKYEEVGAKIAKDANEVWSNCDLIVKVREPMESEIDKMNVDSTLISFFWPAKNESLLKKITTKHATVLAMD